MCRHFPQLLTVEFDGKSMPNLTVKGNAMVRCQICSRHGEVINGVTDWGKEEEKPMPKFKRRRMT